jgi:hypothetical protein
MEKMKKIEILNHFELLKTDIQKLTAHQNDILDGLNKSLKTLSLIEVKLNRLNKSAEKNPLGNRMISTAEEWLNSWKRNHNTGSEVEIKVGLELLLSSKLETRANIPELIKKYSISEKFNIYPNQNVSKNLIGILNLTQDDDDSGTSDIALVYQDGTRSNYSVTQWNGKLEKCMCNPSPLETYNLQKHISCLKEENVKVYNDVLKYAKENYGKTPSKEWKRKKYLPANLFIAKLANKASEEWNGFTDQERGKRLEKILDLTVSLNTKSDGIIYFNKATNKIQCVYAWNLKINLTQGMQSRSEKCYVIHYLNNNPNEIFIKTQAKYNNGVMEGLNSKSSWITKPGRPFSSWNSVVHLEKIFDMKELKYLY